ncbi:MAG: Mov34/MPN/PAD-1 family protein [Burkholderiales bacterium]|nr:Mov34/MPN/PAD-1 family protein [Burkholderiales bacterium]
MTQPSVGHRYVAEIHAQGKQALDTPALEIDWIPALEWCHFQEVRRGAARLHSVPGLARIEPRWDEHAGPPYVAGLEVRPLDREAARAETLPLVYLLDPVRQAVSELVLAGGVPEGVKYTWRICAYAVDSKPDGERTRAPFCVEEAPVAGAEPHGRCLSALLPRAARHGPARENGAPPEFPVFFARGVLAEAAHAASAAGELETGGVLLGRLSRDAQCGDLILEVSAQVPASEALAEDASLRFTPRTWQAVEAALRLRRAHERIVGWWHSHPRRVWPCHACTPQQRARCPSNRPFFSGMDAGFHRTAFQGPANVALLLSFQEDPAPRRDLFGWRQGMVAAREYYVLEETR